MRRISIGLLALSLTASAAPAIAQATCDDFLREIDRSVDEASRSNAEKLFGGRSAIQAAQIDATISSALALVQINMDLMAAAKCPLPTRPIMLTSYYPVAQRCLAVGGDQNCLRKNWRAEP